MEYGVFTGFIAFFAGIAMGLPLCWVFLGSALVSLLAIQGSSSFMPGTFYHAIDNYVLLAIAFFIFAGTVITCSQILTSI